VSDLLFKEVRLVFVGRERRASGDFVRFAMNFYLRVSEIKSLQELLII
jgi:hypothetical protein